MSPYRDGNKSTKIKRSLKERFDLLDRGEKAKIQDPIEKFLAVVFLAIVTILIRANYFANEVIIVSIMISFAFAALCLIALIVLLYGLFYVFYWFKFVMRVMDKNKYKDSEDA